MGTANNNIYVPTEAREAFDMLMDGGHLNGADPQLWGLFASGLQEP